MVRPLPRCAAAKTGSTSGREGLRNRFPRTRGDGPSVRAGAVHYRKIMGCYQLRILGVTQRTTSRKRMARLSGQMSRSHHPVEKAMAPVPVRDARQSYAI